MFARLLRPVKWIAVALAVLIVLLSAPVAYVETFCRADMDQAEYAPIITDPEFQRAEANSYLTYPEWHIVYAYEGLANTLQSADEHAFGYFSSIASFWRSFCDLNRIANRHGGGDFNTRATIHTIGVSFTLEMAMKAIYEETLGQLFALLRGTEKTPQDRYAATMADDYAEFLQQTPWYKFDFDQAVTELWAEPLTSPLRGWERRLALGGEWKAKAQYAKAIAGAVAAVGPAQLSIQSVVEGMLPSELAALNEVDVVDTTPDHVVIETPRYRKFTRLAQAIVESGGTFVEIAGNDDVMLSLTVPRNADLELANGEMISRIARSGFGTDRLLVSVKVHELGPLLTEAQAQGISLEHLYDY